MKINKKLIPIKVHYFCLLGSVSTVIPFVMVIAVERGIPVWLAGTLNAATLLVVLLLKPAMATLADTFPSFRRIIFLLNLNVAMVFMVSIYFVPSMQVIAEFQGQLVRVMEHGNASDPTYLFSGRNLQDSHRNKSTKHDGKCHVTAASDCLAMCDECDFNNQRFHLVPLTLSDEENQNEEKNVTWEILHMNMTQPSKTDPSEEMYHYRLEGLRSTDEGDNISIVCERAELVGPSCPSVVERWEFWLFAVLLVVANVSLATVTSFTDAITVDTIGPDGNYGSQRAWGTIGFGLIAPIAGGLVDWWSGSSLVKELAPAFIVCGVLGVSDVVLSAVFLKIPMTKVDKPVLQEVWPLLRQPHFFVFCFFVIINGAFNGFCIYFLLLMQEDMAQGTSAMDYLKFLQGFTLFVQCSLEAPMMFISHWFMRRFGAQRVISLVFLLYVIRFLGLAAAGAWGPVWSTLVAELMNGPCYGLGYTATVVYAAKVSPAGTNTTVQSLVNVLYESCGLALSLFLGGVMCEAIGCHTMYLILGILSVVIFILHVVFFHFISSPDAEKKAEHVSGDQDVKENAKVKKDMQNPTTMKTVDKNNYILEATHL